VRLRRQTNALIAVALSRQLSGVLSVDHSNQCSAFAEPTMTFMSSGIKLAYQLHGTFRLKSKRLVYQSRQRSHSVQL